MRIGPHELPNNLFVAPMAGVTDRPFRQLCKRLGAGYAVSEMVTSRRDLWHTLKTSRRADHSGEPGPIAVQIAGTDAEMMAEIQHLHQSVKPIETLFVVDAMTGQDAVNTAKAFNDRLDFTGVVLTKLDGDTRGGAALSIKAVTGLPSKIGSDHQRLFIRPMPELKVLRRAVSISDVLLSFGINAPAAIAIPIFAGVFAYLRMTLTALA